MIGPGTLKVLHTAGGAALKAYQQRKVEEARQALLKALGKGRVWAINEDQAAAALFAYIRAAEEGAARINLQMIAEAFANAAQEPTFAPETFRRHVRMLADISRDEIQVVAKMIKLRHECDGMTLPEQRTFIREKIRDELVGPGKFFGTVGELDQNLSSLLRTGLIISESAYGGTFYMPTGLLIEIERLVDFGRAADGDD